jgi:transcriptional regulator with XRE-family HTH domain
MTKKLMKGVSMSDQSFEYEKKCFINGVKYLLEKEEMYQSDLAKGVGVSQQHISYILSGKKVGSSKMRHAISQFLGYSYHDIIKLGQAVLQSRKDIIHDITGSVKIMNTGLKNNGKLTGLIDIKPILDLFPYFGDYIGFSLTCAQAEGISEQNRKENILYSINQFLRHAMSESGIVSEKGGFRLCEKEKPKIEEKKEKYQIEDGKAENGQN